LAAREETQVSQDPGDRDPTSTFACECIAAGYLGQNMRDPERAEAYIRMAADNPNVEAELPESGRAFWKSARFNYRLWRVIKK
jgi:hypothetical protein